MLISKSVSYFLLVSIHDRYAQNGLSDEAMLLFNAMKVEGVNPDKITLIGMLSATASIGPLSLESRLKHMLWKEAYNMTSMLVLP